MQNLNSEKRPERVLVKSTHQEVLCPACKDTIQVSADALRALCKCGQSINWGLRKT